MLLSNMLAVTLMMGLYIVRGDMYCQSPHGSNNRLDEANRDRNNGNRLFDSQNNNRGGYNVGKLSFYEGEVVPFEWTNQHSAGKYQMNHTEIVIQIACEEMIRDGTTTQTIPDAPSKCYNFDCDNDVEYGRHESYDSYQMCKATQRNKGLFTANQNLRGRNGAKYTRQNPQGTRRGYECPEERDYYPYWRPSQWADVAILTADEAKCAGYQAESQNVRSKPFCQPNQYWWAYQRNGRGNNGEIPNNQVDCDSPTAPNYTVPTGYPNAGQTYRIYNWVTPNNAWGISPPACQIVPVSRVNHHGLLGGTNEMMTYNWVVPNTKSPQMGAGEKSFWGARVSRAGQPPKQCVMRLRYNMTDASYSAWASDSSVQAGTNSTWNSPKSSPNADNDPAALRIWEDYGLTYSDVWCNWNGNANSAQQRLCRGYVFRNNPRVDPFDMPLGAPNASDRVQVQLAINTNQFGRTFQDRTHTFYINERPATDFEGNAMDPTSSMTGIRARGKRGNIVQTYPATEYFFTPDHAQLQSDSYVHIQWMGSETNPNNNDGQGKQGTDRSNLCPSSEQQFSKANYFNIRNANMPQSQGGAATYCAQSSVVCVGDAGTNYPARLTGHPYDSMWPSDNANPSSANFPRPNYANSRQVVNENTGFTLEMWKQICLTRRTGRDQIRDAGNMEELDGAGPNQNFPPMKVGQPFGANAQPNQVMKVSYLGTRNNNFSNRCQKGVISIGSAVAVSAIVSAMQGSVVEAATGSGGTLLVNAGMVRVASMPVSLTSWEGACQMDVQFDTTLLAPNAWFTAMIPCEPKSLHTPRVEKQSGGAWVAHPQPASKGYRNGKYMTIVAISQPGTYRAVYEPDPLAIAALVVGCVLFAVCLGGALIKRFIFKS